MVSRLATVPLRLVPALGLALVAAAPVAAQVLTTPRQGQVSIALSAGFSFETSSNLLEEGSTPGLSIAGAATTRSLEYDDVYDTFVPITVDVTYGLSRNDELFARLSYMFAEAETVTFGVTAANNAISGDFDDYNALGLDLGYRYFVPLQGGIRPYLGVTAGFKYVDEIQVDLAIATVGRINNVQLFDTTFTGVFGAQLGAIYEIDRSFAVGIETGLRYELELNEDEGDLAGFGLAEINNDSDRLTVPLMLQGRFSF